MRVMLQQPFDADQIFSDNNNRLGCHKILTSSQQEKAIIIQRAWRKYRNGPSQGNNNITQSETKTQELSSSSTSIDQDNQEMSLSSYSGTDSDLHSDYDSSSCGGREYILNADDDTNNNYFPNLDHPRSDSANSSFYGSLEDALNEIVSNRPPTDKTPVLNSPQETNPQRVLQVQDQTPEDKTSAIWNYLEDQSKIKCDITPNTNESETGESKTHNHSNIDNPFGSDFSQWDVNGKEFASILQDAAIHEEEEKTIKEERAMISWQSIYKPAEEKEKQQPKISSTDHHQNINDDFRQTTTTKAVSSSQNDFPPVVMRPKSYQQHQHSSTQRHSVGSCDNLRRTYSLQHHGNGRKKPSPGETIRGDFDVYNIETAMPNIDWTAMEQHLVKSVKQQQLYHKRRNDREEIRRKLAMGTESDDYYGGEKMTKKPSLTTRLQSGMNLQICFMNETASDLDSQGSDHDNDGGTLLKSKSVHNVGLDNYQKESSTNVKKPKSSSTRPRPSFFKESLHSVFNSTDAFTKNQGNTKVKKEGNEDLDFVTKQARLQAEARMALAQAKEMAHMQMEIEKQRKKKSPITEMVGITMEDCNRGISKQLLCAMNVAQLQVIVNDLHTQIETLNEDLVKYLLDRDDLHMEQDSMLVDIEDLTRFLGAKDETKKRHSQRNLTKKYKKGKK